MKTVKVGFFALPGYHEVVDNTKRQGDDVDFLTLMQRYANLNYQYVGYDKTWEDMQQMLLDGKIDAIASSSLRKHTGERTLAEFSPENFYVIVRKDDIKLLKEINYAIEQMDANEGDWRNELYYKNYTDISSKQLSFTQKERKYIADVQSGKKTITAAAQPDRNPYSYVKNEKLTGIIPEYFAYLMDMAGLPYTQKVPKDGKQSHNFKKMSNTNSRKSLSIKPE